MPAQKEERLAKAAEILLLKFNEGENFFKSIVIWEEVSSTTPIPRPSKNQLSGRLQARPPEARTVEKCQNLQGRHLPRERQNCLKAHGP